jgi:hypothetical protein
MNIFTANLLSAVGSPPRLNTSLSASNLSVVVDALSAYVGLAYNPVSLTTTNSAIQAATIQGCSLRIAAGYNNSVFALVKADRSATLFTFLSAGAPQTPTASTLRYSTPELRRLSVLGYA